MSKRHEPTRTTTARLWWWTIGVTVVLEVITLLLRFGFKLESTRDTRTYLSPLTFGLRIHHGYIGLLVLCIAATLAWGLHRPKTGAAAVLFVIGGSLLLSDFIHHFLVLWPLTGSPQFDLRY